MWIHLEMAEWCIPSWVTLTFTLTSDLISRFFVSGAYLLSSNVPRFFDMSFLFGHYNL